MLWLKTKTVFITELTRIKLSVGKCRNESWNTSQSVKQIMRSYAQKWAGKLSDKKTT